MSSNRKLLFGAVLVVAALVFWGLYTAINRATSAPAPTPVPVAQTVSRPNGGQIFVAAGDIPQGAIITKEMLMPRSLGGGSTTGFITNPESQAVGFVTRVPISKNAQIRPADDFVGHISELGIAALLRPGTRAMVIPLANKPTLHDLVHIGNYVDVNAAFDGQEARSIVQGVRVLAVDVFVNDFPSVNGAMRGPYKADPKGQGIASSPQPGAPGAPGGPGPTPTPTPAPAQAPARPDAALTLEVTPVQANSILLAQASGSTIDFTVLPALLGGQGAVSSVGPDGTPTETEVLPVSVTKAQIAPYAERKKAAGGGAPTRIASTGGNQGDLGPRRHPRGDFGTGPIIPPPSNINPGNIGITPVQPPVSSTYNIPIYADGKPVRTETVLTPQN